ncbi:TonB-dependent receptor plug domain-containing protein [Limnohabitans sp. 63ED37-2]|uniref:TonB-dependent receptor plug domain-containing protein n=1 Tax=Limnohabitans sp. 63ED37-2 TaxID=1678128 RepID=UPI0007061B9E|nr:TonB-dependent receptor [Limnohabitans sp. 63ED37-2]ALK90218.1 Vitamin B12 transporter BtuB precursor [Limnohabitans sp. 63ED37-2]
MKKTLSPIQLKTIVLCLGAACAKSPAWAQTSNPAPKTYPPVEVVDKPLEYRQFEKVEITGSSIVRKEQTQALPVQIITRDDIRRSGASSMVDVLHNLPAMSMWVNSTAMSTTIGGYTTASLRGLPAGTLLLLNGKRLAPYGRQTIIGVDRPSVDINTVPLSAIEKIEILSDGASSLYGSDAIAGVINIITRTEQKGVEIMAEKLGTSQGGGQGHQISLNAGKGNLNKDGYSLRLTAELFHRDALQASDRPQYAQGRYEVERDGQRYAIDGSRVTSYATPGTFFESANAATGSPRKVFSLLHQDGQCPSGYVPFLGQPSCQYNTYSALTLYPQQDSRKLLLSGEKWLGGTTTAYAEILHSRLEDSEMAAQGWRQLIYTLGKSPDSVGYQEALRAGMDPARTQFLWSPSLMHGLLRAYEQNNWRVATGLKGEWQGWDYKAELYKAQAHVVRRLEVTDFAGQGLVSGRVLTDPNMLRPLTPDNPLTATLNGLRNVWNTWDDSKTHTTVGHVRASRPLMEIQGKDVMLGAGLEWRREGTNYQYVSNTEQQPSFQAERDIQAAYLELQLPVTPQWDVTASTRWDRYSDLGTTHNNKLASRYDFENGWSARASWGTGFRAPSVAQLQNLTKLYAIGSTTFLNECGPDILTVLSNLNARQNRNVACERSLLQIYGTGNPDLKPELSTQKSLGLAYRPTRNFSVTADWWSVHMHDVISTLAGDIVYADPIKYSQFYLLDNNNKLAMQLPNYNIGQREKSGIDFDMRWRAPVDMGQLNLFVQGAYNLKSKDQSVPGEAYTSDLARYNSITDTITPRMRLRWIAGLTTATWSLHGVVNYTSGYDDRDRSGVNLTTLQSTPLTGFYVKSFTTLDLTATYQVNTNVSLRATMGNVLNRQAPQAFSATAAQVFGYNTRDHSLWGRTLGLALLAKF